MSLVVERDGRHLHSYSTGDGQPLVLIPGLGGGSRLFGTLPLKFARHGFRCITYDPIGVPPSDPLAPEHHFRDAADDLLAVIDTQAAERCHLLGTSFGSKVAMCLCARHPERVNRMVLLAASALPTGRARRVHRFFEILATNLEADLFGEAIAPFLFGHSFLDRKAGVAGDIIRAIRPDPQSRQLMVAQALSMQEFTGADLAAAIRRPTLCIAGSEDSLTPTVEVEATAAAIPTATYLEIPRAGHSLLLEEGRVFDEVVAYLRCS